MAQNPNGMEPTSTRAGVYAEVIVRWFDAGTAGLVPVGAALEPHVPCQTNSVS
jgi:hypothetical protein